MQTFSGVASSSIENCTNDLHGIDSSASASCNLSIFESNIDKYRQGVAITSGADLRTVEIISYEEKNSSLVSRRLLSGTITVDFNFRLAVPRYFAAQALSGLAGLQDWVLSQGLPGITVGATVFACGAGAEPDPISNLTCRACHHGETRRNLAHARFEDAPCMFCVVLRRSIRLCYVAGFYKNASDNSSCVACPHASTTISKGAFLLSQCTCVSGWYSTTLLAFNETCTACNNGSFCQGDQHIAPCAKVCPDSAGAHNFFSQICNSLVHHIVHLVSIE